MKPKYIIECDWLNTDTMEYEGTYEYAFTEEERDCRAELFIGDAVSEQVRWQELSGDGTRLGSCVYVKQDTGTDYIIITETIKHGIRKIARVVHGRISLCEAVIKYVDDTEYDIVMWCVLYPNGARSAYKIEKGSEYIGKHSR